MTESLTDPHDAGDLSHVAAARLAELLRLPSREHRLWHDADLAGVLRHQLSSPVSFDLTGWGEGGADVGPGQGEESRERTEPARTRPLTFADLLHGPGPPPELLRHAKDFFKRAKGEPDGPIPQQVATALYYAAILTARLRCSHRISALPDAELLKGIRWGLSQPWLDERTRGLLSEGMATIREAGGEAGGSPGLA